MSLRDQRLFYLALLDPTRPVDELVERLVLLANADLGYCEVADAGVRSAYACAGIAIDAVRTSISTHIMQRALLGGEVVATACAARDERFAELESVRTHGIQAVLCAPLAYVSGVIYLQGAHTFSPTARGHVRLAARRLGERCLLQQLATSPTPLSKATRMFQRQQILSALERTSWNVTDAARLLSVARSYLHRMITEHDLRRLEELHRSVY